MTRADVFEGVRGLLFGIVLGTIFWGGYLLIMTALLRFVSYLDSCTP